MFINKYGVEDSGIWYQVLKDLTPKAIEMGIERLITMQTGLKFAEFPPSPMQFRAICLDVFGDLKLPPASQVYQDIEWLNRGINQYSMHPLSRYIATKLPKKFYEMDALHERYEIFNQVYEKVCHLIRQGHKIPDVVIEPIERTNKNSGVAGFYIKKMKSLLSGASI